jgi:CubicO group peptidase (beta-lactamase class C family)
VDALLIARNGVLVYGSYPDAATGLDARHQLNSATRSVASMVVGVVVQKGLLAGYDQPIAELFPEAADLFQADPRKNAITLRHVLTMTAGLGWDSEGVRSTDRDDLHINSAPDAVRYVLEKPMVHDPGIRFSYSSGCSMLLTGLVANVSGMEATRSPRNISSVPWGSRTMCGRPRATARPGGRTGSTSLAGTC